MSKPTFNELIEEIIQRDPRFPIEAYVFVREGLDFTMRQLKKNIHSTVEQRHVSGQELLEGLRQFALEQFGPMAKTVLEHWGIRQCEDFGEIVFNMVDKGILGKTDKDTRSDFKGGYDFDEAFVKPYRPARRAVSRSGRLAAKSADRRRDAPQPNPNKFNSGSS